jgi:hypothetical protein
MIGGKNQSKYKWFLFNISDDFTYIFIKNWGKYLPKFIVMKAIEDARNSNKTVSVIVNNRIWPEIYALPAAPLKFREQETMTENFLIFGPYLRDAESNLLLLRNDDKFTKKKIPKANKTRCLWIYCDNLKSIQNANPKKMLLTWGRDPTDCQEVTELK